MVLVRLPVAFRVRLPVLPPVPVRLLFRPAVDLFPAVGLLLRLAEVVLLWRELLRTEADGEELIVLLLEAGVPLTFRPSQPSSCRPESLPISSTRVMAASLASFLASLLPMKNLCFFFLFLLRSNCLALLYRSKI